VHPFIVTDLHFNFNFLFHLIAFNITIIIEAINTDKH
jgi:hypothetical protein